MEDNCQKIKLLKLMELLRQDTDAQHPMIKTDVCARLVEMGITCDRRTLGRDVRLLREQGYTIGETMVHHDKAYYVDDGSFSLPEVKILMDAVQAAGFIPEGKSAVLTQKLASLAGSHEAELLTEHVVRFNTRKHTNEDIYSTVASLELALRMRTKATFRYFDLNEAHEKVYRQNRSRYKVDPIALVHSDDNYYLLCYSAKHHGVRSYRLDRMEGVIAEEKTICKHAMELMGKVEQYTEQAFRMFAGEPKTVTLEFDASLLGVMYDKFGEELAVTPAGEDRFRAEVNVQVSRVFFGWVFQFAGGMKILSPNSVKDAFAAQVALFGDAGEA